MSEPYDRDLAILSELEQEVQRAAVAALAPPAPAPAPRRERDGWRRPRRTAILVVLACLVSATATAAVISSRSEVPRRGPDATVARVSGSDGYEFRVHAIGKRVCTTFVLRDALDTICVAPPRRANAALVRSATGPFRRYVYGLTPAAAVSIRVGGERRRVNTHPLAARVRAAVAPAAGLRWFVAPLRRGRTDPIAIVRTLPGGHAIVDCSLGQLDDRC